MGKEEEEVVVVVDGLEASTSRMMDATYEEASKDGARKSERSVPCVAASIGSEAGAGVVDVDVDAVADREVAGCGGWGFVIFSCA